MRWLLSILALISPALAPAPAISATLACTFTTICSPLTDCQSHPGVPFRFDVLSGTYSFITDAGPVFGTPLPHIAPPAFGLLFETSPGGTVLLSVSGIGEAVMSQQDIAASGTLTSVSYFGTCAPGI